MFTLFLVIVYYIVIRLRESYLEFAAAEYYCCLLYTSDAADE